MMHAVPTMMIECDEDKENLPNEADYEELPGMYKDEEDEEEEEEDEDEDDEEEEDDILLTSKLLCLLVWGSLWPQCFHHYC